MFQLDVDCLCLVVLAMINGITAELNLSPYASWGRNGTTVDGQANGAAGTSLHELSSPFGISISEDDVLFISDTINNRIIVLDLNSMNSTSIIGSGPGSNMSQLSHPRGLFISDISLYILDEQNARLQKMSPNGSNPSTVPGFTGLNSPYYLYVDNSANIYLSDTQNHRVLFYLSNSTNATVVAGTGTGTPGSSNSELHLPYGIFVDPNGTIYIADFQNHRIMKWIPRASSGVLVAGTGIPGTSLAQLNSPTQVIVDTNEYMYTSESGNSRILRWAPNSNVSVCIAACTTISGPASTQLNSPNSLAFDSNGSLYVCDTSNSRIQKFPILDYQNQTIASSPLQTSTTIIAENSTNHVFTTATSAVLLAAKLTTTSYIKDDTTTSSPSLTSSISTEHTTAVITSTNTLVLVSHQSLYAFVSPICSNSTSIGLRCDISGTLCDLLRPCQNNGTCQSNGTVHPSYSCSCLTSFTDTECQVDRRPCQLNTCLNSGQCNESSNTTFVCLCKDGWKGIHCQTKINYCDNTTCKKNSVCRPLFLNYSCDCLGASYSGRHCEITATNIVIRQLISTSFGYIAVLSLVGAAMFVVIMDVLKYCFDIDPVSAELTKKTRLRKRKPIIQRFIYVTASPE